MMLQNIKKKMSFDFKNIKVKDIEKEIHLKDKAESDGKNNLPSETSEVFSITENEAIIKYIVTYNNNCNTCYYANFTW